MKATTYTPGPWKFTQWGIIGRQVDEHNSQRGTGRIFGTYVCTVEALKALSRKSYYAPGCEAYANARLIAAAPDLFEALEALLVHAESKLIRTDEPCFVYARGVLAKAVTGEYPLPTEISSEAV